MRLLSTILLLLLASIQAFAVEAKQISYKSGDETVNAVLYEPRGKGPFPALVVIHEWWGLVDWVKDQASKLSEQGYATLAVDLYRGKAGTDSDVAHELSRALPPDRAKRDLKAAFDFLAGQQTIDKQRIGAIGWCMGGGYALELALDEPRLKAAVINYGHLATDPAQLKGTNAAFLGIFGAQDRGIPVEDVRRFEQQLKSSGKRVEIVIYPDAGHAFQNPGNRKGYRPSDAADAWKRTVQFLDTTLKGVR